MGKPPVNDTPVASAGLTHDAYAAFRFRNYRLYSLGWVLATIGAQMQSVAIGWEIYQWTGSAMHLGLVGLAQALPLILFALPAGHVADRYDRRWVAGVSLVLAASCAVALGMVSISHSHGRIETPWAIQLIYVLLFASGSCLTFGRPARAALLPLIVPTKVFPNAVAWNSSMFEVAGMAGPALGGIVIGFSIPAAYFLSAAGTLVFVTTLLMLRYEQAPRPVEPMTLESLGAGVRFVYQKKVILATITLDLFAVLLGGATYLLPIFAKDILHVGAVGFGWLRAAPAMGAFTMALVQAHRPPMQKAGRTLLWAVAGFGAATIGFGLSTWFPLSMLMLFLTGAFDNISVVVRHTLVQTLTPDAMRGRVSSVNQVFIGSSNELGGLESGLTAAWFGAVASVVGGGIGTILVVLAVMTLWPEVKRIGKLTEAGA